MELFLALGLVLAGATPSLGGLSSVTLAWDPSPTGGIVGYRVYEGGASGVYTNVIDTGSATSVTVSNLISGATYYFAVTAVSTSGMESAYSNEITYTVPKQPRPWIRTVTGLSGKPGGIVAPPPMSIILSVDGSPGQTLNVLRSQDLLTWTVIGTLTLDDTGLGDFTDSNTGGRPKGFYRVQEVAPGPPKLQIRAPGGGGILLTGTGQAGRTYDVLSTTDLKVWTVIGAVTADAAGSFTFTDPTGGTCSRCLYRLRAH